jgi:hypothetical protein
MSVGSISSSAVATAAYDAARVTGDAKAAAGTPTGVPTIADHVAADDDGAPVRSYSTTQGTLVDTYL